MLVLRDATLADVALLSAWDTEPHVVAATGDDDIIDWEHELSYVIDFGGPQWKWDFIAEVDGRPFAISAGPDYTLLTWDLIARTG